MRVLVSGATGFTGGHLARHLATRGAAVRGLVRPRSRPRAAALQEAGIEIVLGDLADDASLARACDGVDTVYHIAATFRNAGQPDAAYRAVNALGTRALLDAALAAGVTRFVHCSTVGVHGHVERPPADEDAPLAPGDIYQETKLEGERLARSVGTSGDMEVVVARPAGIYGPGDTRFLKLFRGIAKRRFPLLGSGTVCYHFTYIDDLVEGFRLCGEAPVAAGRTYILAGRHYTPLTELVRVIADEVGVEPPRWRFPVWPVWAVGAMCEAVCVPLGVEPPLYRRRVDFFVKNRAFDMARARRELGFSPAIDLVEGVRRTADWYRREGLL
ncbi:MAG: NAD-dependent epimerase/dehydratase family protein [Acidobacteria bacterium]|nr:NAD-dependent epimerase/dehydratase family protein [Acidobacteriota bacterium]